MTKLYIAQTKIWTLERVIRLMAGTFVLLGIALSAWVHPYWIALPALVGVNLVVFSLTGLCPMAMILHKLGVREG
ncbi:MAG: DUF2892 domain-containing protein [Nitrospirae bacterium]|nr:DUF2892 domain-containing protein [Nitrospirota bacterium]